MAKVSRLPALLGHGTGVWERQCWVFLGDPRRIRRRRPAVRDGLGGATHPVRLNTPHNKSEAFVKLMSYTRTPVDHIAAEVNLSATNEQAGRVQRGQ
jgi:hypothetical protein